MKIVMNISQFILPYIIGRNNSYKEEKKMKITIDTEQESAEVLQLIVQLLNKVQELKTGTQKIVKTDIQKIQEQSPFHTIIPKVKKEEPTFAGLSNIFDQPLVTPKPVPQEEYMQSIEQPKQPQFQIPNIFDQTPTPSATPVQEQKHQIDSAPIRGFNNIFAEMEVNKNNNSEEKKSDLIKPIVLY